MHWADEAYAIMGNRLLLAPMDIDLLHDASFDGPLMQWAAVRKVPLAIFCGFRFLFPEDAFSEIDTISKKYPFPFDCAETRRLVAKLATLIQQTGVEIWTGMAI